MTERFKSRADLTEAVARLILSLGGMGGAAECISRMAGYCGSYLCQKRVLVMRRTGVASSKYLIETFRNNTVHMIIFE